MKGYRKKTRTAPRKNVKNKFVVTYAGFKTPTQTGKESQIPEQEKKVDDKILFEKGDD